MPEPEVGLLVDIALPSPSEECLAGSCSDTSSLDHLTGVSENNQGVLVDIALPSPEECLSASGSAKGLLDLLTGASENNQELEVGGLVDIALPSPVALPSPEECLSASGSAASLPDLLTGAPENNQDISLIQNEKFDFDLPISPEDNLQIPQDDDLMLGPVAHWKRNAKVTVMSPLTTAQQEQIFMDTQNILQDMQSDCDPKPNTCSPELPAATSPRLSHTISELFIKPPTETKTCENKLDLQSDEQVKKDCCLESVVMVKQNGDSCDTNNEQDIKPAKKSIQKPRSSLSSACSQLKQPSGAGLKRASSLRMARPTNIKQRATRSGSTSPQPDKRLKLAAETANQSVTLSTLGKMAPRRLQGLSGLPKPGAHRRTPTASSTASTDSNSSTASSSSGLASRLKPPGSMTTSVPVKGAIKHLELIKHRAAASGAVKAQPLRAVHPNPRGVADKLAPQAKPANKLIQRPGFHPNATPAKLENKAPVGSTPSNSSHSRLNPRSRPAAAEPTPVLKATQGVRSLNKGVLPAAQSIPTPKSRTIPGARSVARQTPAERPTPGCRPTSGLRPTTGPRQLQSSSVTKPASSMSQSMIHTHDAVSAARTSSGVPSYGSGKVTVHATPVKPCNRVQPKRLLPSNSSQKSTRSSYRSSMSSQSSMDSAVFD